MLDRIKLSQDLARVARHLFPDLGDALEQAHKVWERIAQDPQFKERAAQAEATFLVPTWKGDLNETFAISVQEEAAYTVVAVDGSQVYPDRHIAGAGCFLLNVGGVTLSYGATSTASFFSQPRVCVAQELEQISKHAGMSRDVVDALREKDELAYSYIKANEVVCNTGQTPVVLFDGTIIFWPLEGMQDEIRSYFITAYMDTLHKLYEQRIPCAGYISMPKSRELINLVKLGLCRFSVANCGPCTNIYSDFPCKQVESLIDAALVKRFVEPGQRTTLFSSSSHIVKEYPEHLQPWFCYVRTQHEVIRLEMPAWVAHDQEALDQVCAVALDQCDKGHGYPVCLAEAHEQAVVKGPDRDFFYHLITRQALGEKKNVTHSQKSIKKRGIRV